MQFFKKDTIAHQIIYAKTSFESLPEIIERNDISLVRLSVALHRCLASVNIEIRIKYEISVR
jgi:hypothetical protein